MGETFDDTQIGAYQEGRVDFHNDRRISLQNGARMPILYPGEDVKAVNAARPHSNFEVFESAALRNIAAATGLSTQQVTQDWSDVNYSSARSAMLEAWKTLTRRRDDFSVGFAQPILSAFIEEIHDTEDLPLPSGAPHFLDARRRIAVLAGWGQSWLGGPGGGEERRHSGYGCRTFNAGNGIGGKRRRGLGRNAGPACA